MLKPAHSDSIGTCLRSIWEEIADGSGDDGETWLACSGGSTQLQFEPCWLLGMIPTGTSPTSWRAAGSHRTRNKFATLPPQQSRRQGSRPSLSKHKHSKIGA